MASPTSVPPGLSSIVPGSIFQDDIPPILVDPSTVDPSQISPPAGVGAGSGGGATQIEVNSTIQMVLIALGIVIGVLVLIAIVAAYYISHKNKSAEEQKEKEKEKEKGKQLPSISDVDGEGDLKSVVVLPQDSEKQQQQERSTGLEGPLSSDSFIPSDGLLTEEIGNRKSASEDESAGSGVGHGYSRSNTPGRETDAFTPSIGSSVHSCSTPAISRSGLSTSGNGSLGSSSNNGNSNTVNSDPRSSIAHVTQAYATRQCILVTPVAGGSGRTPLHPMGGVERMRAGISESENYHHPSNPFYGNGNASAIESAPALGQRNRDLGRASPSPSFGSNNPSMTLVDPFKTNNNSTSSLNVLAATSSTTTVDRDDKGSTTHTDSGSSTKDTKDWSKAQEYLRQRKSEDSYNPRVVLRQSLKSSPSPTAMTNRYTLNILSEPITLLHSNTASTTSVTSASYGVLSVEISYQPPLTPTSPIGGFDRFASRRAVAATGTTAASRSTEELARPSGRNGAAVFEGATLQRNNRLLEGEGDDGQDMLNGVGERRGRRSLDFAEQVIVSLPIPHVGGLLDDDDDDDDDDDGGGGNGGHGDEIPPSRVFQHRHQPSNGTASGMPYVLETQREHPQPPQTMGHADPKLTLRPSKDKKVDSGGGGGGKSSYLDDYREQQKLRKQQQQQQREGAGGAEGGILTTGRRRSSKFIQNALHRASQLYAPSSSSSSSSARDTHGSGQTTTTTTTVEA